MQNSCVNHGFLNMDIAVACCFGQRQKEKQLYPVFMKIIVTTRIRHSRIVIIGDVVNERNAMLLSVTTNKLDLI